MQGSMKKVLLGSSTLLAIGAVGHVAEAATLGVPIQAVILDPVQLSAAATLNFGDISVDAGGAGGTVVVAFGGGVTDSAPNVRAIGATHAAGGFTLKGAAGRAVDITLPATATIDDVGAGAPMTVSNFTIEGSVATALTPYTTNAVTAGAALAMGGTLTVPNTQLPGTYNGTVTVTAVYQ